MRGMPTTEAELTEFVLKLLRNLSAEDTTAIHKKADTNVRAESIHHTLGTRRGQAAFGDHTHNGTDSNALLPNVVFTGSRASNLAGIVQQITQALVRLGANDNTTA